MEMSSNHHVTSVGIMHRKWKLDFSLFITVFLGSDCDAMKQNRVAHIQSMSGTGGLRLGFEILKAHYPVQTVYISDPTWEVHPAVCDHVGYTDIRRYKYWDTATNNLNFTGMLNDMNDAPEGSIIVVHVCCHNPTGIDLNRDHWKQLGEVAIQRKLLFFFDMAYGGFASGDPDFDAWPIRYFIGLGLEVVYCQSFSKNFGLYGERCGTLGIVCHDSSTVPIIEQQLISIARKMYLSPPLHGARIVSMVLNDNNLYHEW